MSIPFGHQQLHNRYCFEGEIKLITPLRISSGRASDNTDAPFMRSFDETPYIPGSSLRGAIRSEVERIIVTVGDAAGLKTCTLFEKGDCAEKVRVFLLELEEKERDEREDKTKDERIAEFAEEKLCDVCKLFGSTVYASRLIFEDARPVMGKIRLREINNRVYNVTGFENSKSLWEALVSGKEICEALDWKEGIQC